MEITVSSTKEVPVITVRADYGGENISPGKILSTANPFKSNGVQIELSGHLRLSEDMEFEGFNNLQFLAVGKAIIEQQNSYNDASPLSLRNCRSVYISGLKLLGTGDPRSDDNVPQQNGLRIIRSRYVWVERCEFGPHRGDGTIKHGVSISDSSHWVWLHANHFHRVTGIGVIVGSGIWPHPNDINDFDGHQCKNIHIDDNDFDEVATGVGIDDATVLCWVTRNRVRLHYANGITIEDGSTWFIVTENICGPGRGAAVVVGHGQTGVWATRGVIANNLASGCNDRALHPPGVFFSVNPRSTAFDRGRASRVQISNNLDIPEG